MAVTFARTVAVPCLMSTVAPGRSGAGASQHSSANRSAEESGRVPAAAMVSPRAMSSSSFSRSATEAGAVAEAKSRPAASIPMTVVSRRGCPGVAMVTGSPTAMEPAAIAPA